MPAAVSDKTALSADNFYVEGADWAHGGPEDLEGGQLRRFAKGQSDSGGIFLTRATPGQIRYAASYCRSVRGLHRVKVDLKKDEVFDYSNPEHIARVEPIVTESGVGSDFLMSAATSNRFGAVDWAVVDEEVLVAAGFRAAIAAERPPGVLGDEPVFSLGVFDPAVLRVVGKFPAPVVAQLWADSSSYALGPKVKSRRVARKPVPAAQALGTALRTTFNRPDDFRFENGDCEEFACGLVEQARQHGLAAHLLYGYRSYAPEYDGRDETACEKFSHAVAKITLPDGTTDTFDYQGNRAVERWEQKWGRDFMFSDADTGESVLEVDFELGWDPARREHRHNRPAPRYSPTVTQRLAPVLAGVVPPAPGRRTLHPEASARFPAPLPPPGVPLAPSRAHPGVGELGV